jgi:hypothetical protein
MHTYTRPAQQLRLTRFGRACAAQIEAFLWVAGACAATDLLLVLTVQAAGSRTLKGQQAALSAA